MLSAGGVAFPRSGGGKKEGEAKGKEGKAKGGVGILIEWLSMPST